MLFIKYTPIVTSQVATAQVGSDLEHQFHPINDAIAYSDYEQAKKPVNNKYTIHGNEFTIAQLCSVELKKVFDESTGETTIVNELTVVDSFVNPTVNVDNIPAPIIAPVSPLTPPVVSVAPTVPDVVPPQEN